MDAEIVLRSEGKYPSRGSFEDNMNWIYKKFKSPVPMFFRYDKSRRSDLSCSCSQSKGEDWKKIRSNAAKQVMPRRVRNFVEPLCDIAEELHSHLESIQDEAGDVQDIALEMNKWAFQGTIITYIPMGLLSMRYASEHLLKGMTYPLP